MLVIHSIKLSFQGDGSSTSTPCSNMSPQTQQTTAVILWKDDGKQAERRRKEAGCQEGKAADGN